MIKSEQHRTECMIRLTAYRKPLLGTDDVAFIFGVSRGYVFTMRAKELAPVVYQIVSGVPVWTREIIESYIRNYPVAALPQ